MKANTRLAYSDLKIYLVPTHVTKITNTNLFQVQKPNFVLLEINRYFGEIPYHLGKVLANKYWWIVIKVLRANIFQTM